MSLDSTMTSGGAEPKGGGQIKTGGQLDSPFEGASQPPTGGVNAINDHNICPAFSKPRASGGIPVKFFEQVSGSPGTLESTLENENIVR